MTEKQLLDGIHSPDDLKKLTPVQLTELCGEIRDSIIDTVSRNGGHLAPNLGIVELTVALHRVFHMPEDKIVWDVGHQSYVHKILTGRKDRFPTIRTDGGLSGFPLREESEYDCFSAGHAGTAISAAMGFAAARDARNGKEHVIAVIGDGSLACGLSLEALNNVRTTCKNLIIILNDNKMSISRSVGAIPNYLNRIITGRSYNHFKAFAKMAVRRMPSGAEIIGGSSGFPLKPAPDALLHILERTGSSAAHSWVCGDNHTDLDAAKNAGMKSVFASYGFGTLGNSVYDRTIHSFSGLTELLLPETGKSV